MFYIDIYELFSIQSFHRVALGSRKLRKRKKEREKDQFQRNHFFKSNVYAIILRLFLTTESQCLTQSTSWHT